jgi:hypothetical protein
MFLATLAMTADTVLSVAAPHGALVGAGVVAGGGAALDTFTAVSVQIAAMTMATTRPWRVRAGTTQFSRFFGGDGDGRLTG